VSVKVKICGVCSVADARASVLSGADFLGVNFHPTSPRCVDPETARAIVDAAGDVPVAGVFVDAPRAQVEDVASRAGLRLLQFHGQEPPDYCAGWRLPVIKVVRPRPGEDAAVLAAAFRTDYLMVDAWIPGQAGGTGVAVDPEVVRGLPAARLFVAGGLRPETVGEVVRMLRPFAVDVASGVEQSPGRKDHGKVTRFIYAAKQA
jgi:phosphoribosylanthranilate isomerase